MSKKARAASTDNLVIEEGRVLYSRAIEGDKNAWAQLITDAQRKVLGHIRKVYSGERKIYFRHLKGRDGFSGPTDPDADRNTEILDIFQEAAARACKFITDKKPLTAEFSTLLCGFANYIFLERWKKKSKQPILEEFVEDDEERIFEPLDVEEYHNDPVHKIVVRRCFDLLNQEEQNLLSQKHIDGLTLQQIAKELGVAVSTVHDRLKKVEETLRYCIDCGGPNSAP